jgi:exosortase/archaeosortase family protein
VPTATPAQRAQTLSFLLSATAWSLGLFGAFRLAWLEAHAILPLTGFQARIAEWLAGPPSTPVNVTLACSGIDVLSLCAGTILGYPAPWRARVAGAAAGTALILGLNVVRIGALGRAAASPSFDLLHVYVWPALLTFAGAAYVFTWMRWADGPPASLSLQPPPDRRFIAAADLGPLLRWSTVLLAAFVVTQPLYLDSALLRGVAALVAKCAAGILHAGGIVAVAQHDILITARGAFMVTTECISSPLIPIYAAAAIACVHTVPRRLALLAAGVPVFVALGVARLLVVALPATIVASPAFAIHAFSQLLAGAIVICLAAAWRYGAGARAGRQACIAIALGALVTAALGAWPAAAYGRLFAGSIQDPQGAVLLLPSFQVGLFVGLVTAAFSRWRWRLLAGGAATLIATQVLFFAALHLLARYSATAPDARGVRAWALAVPLVVAGMMVRYDRARD